MAEYVERAAQIATSSLEDQRETSQVPSTPDETQQALVPLPITYVPGETAFIKDDNGFIHLSKSGEDTHTPFRVEAKEYVTESDLTLQDTIEAYKMRVAEWKKAPCYTDIRSFFNQTIMHLASLMITSCICVGIGTFTIEHTYFPGVSAAMDQLAAFQTMLEILRQKNTIKDIYFQSTVINKLDIEFLGTQGITVVEFPAAQNLMTNKTLLYAPHADPLGERFQVEGMFETAYPAVFIGARLEDLLDRFDYKMYQNPQQYSMNQYRAMFLRVFKHFYVTRLKREICTEPDGTTEMVYWKPDE